MIDWTKPVKCSNGMDAEPLFDANGSVRACLVGSVVYSHSAFDRLILRNAPPPKPEPVLREAWVNCYAVDNVVGHATKGKADMNVSRNREACIKIAWMSDGSPVPGDDATRATVETLAEFHDSLEWDELIAERDALRLDLESRIQESNETRKVIANLTAGLTSWKDNANDALDELKAANDRIEQMAPVVDAAVVWGNGEPNGAIKCFEAVRAYLRDVAYPKKTAEEAVANVAAMMGPVKSCETCEHGPDHFDCDADPCLPPNFQYWQPQIPIKPDVCPTCRGRGMTVYNGGADECLTCGGTGKKEPK